MVLRDWSLNSKKTRKNTRPSHVKNNEEDIDSTNSNRQMDISKDVLRLETTKSIDSANTSYQPLLPSTFIRSKKKFMKRHPSM